MQRLKVILKNQFVLVQINPKVISLKLLRSIVIKKYKAKQF